MEMVMVLIAVVVGFVMGKGITIPIIGSRPRVIRPQQDTDEPTPRVVARTDQAEAQMEENRSDEEMYGKSKRKPARR